MLRFRLKQWRETFEEVIINAENRDEAERIADEYPEGQQVVEVVKEVESTLRTEVEPIETTEWIAEFDDPHHHFSAESQPFAVEDDSEAKEKAIEWLCGINDQPYNYTLSIPQVLGEWKVDRQPQTDTAILTRDLEHDAWLTLIEVYQPR